MQENIQNRIRERAGEFIKDYPTRGYARKLACILFVLDILEPFSEEYKAIRGRLDQLDITARKTSLIEQDYFRKFIRTTKLKNIPPDQIRPGDILLLNEYSSSGQIDHLGLYIGSGKYIHLKRNRTFCDSGEIVLLEENIQKIKEIVRGKIDG